MSDSTAGVREPEYSPRPGSWIIQVAFLYW